MEKVYGKGSIFPKLEKGKLRIYGNRFCPYVERVLLVLAAKKIPYEVVNIALDNKPDWFLEKTSAGRVPVLEQDDKLLKESIIIADYLDEAYPGRKLLPKDPFLRAKSRITLEEFGKVSMNIFNVTSSQFYGELLPFDDSVKEILKVYEKELHNNKFFGGEEPGMLDYMLWPFFKYASPLIPEDDYPLLLVWIHNMSQDPAAQETTIPREVNASFTKTRLSGHPDYDIGL